MLKSTLEMVVSSPDSHQLLALPLPRILSLQKIYSILVSIIGMMDWILLHPFSLEKSWKPSIKLRIHFTISTCTQILHMSLIIASDPSLIKFLSDPSVLQL